MVSELENAKILAAIASDNQLRDLIVRWDPDPPTISPEAAARIDACWNYQVDAAKSSGHTLFNGPITRLLQVTATPTSITLRLGPADYKSYVATCLRDRTWFQNYAPEAIVEALGNSALVTRGKQALLALRSASVSAYPNRWHLIGGVVEGLDRPNFPAARSGLEAHLRQELSEELNLSTPELRPAPWPRPLALARDEFLHQPELFWQWDLRVPLESIIQNLDPAEHSDAQILRKNDMTPELFEQLTPVARLAWQMWCDQPT